eukprot:g9345.t3
MAAWEPFRQLCIVGAGPAGLQLGHFLSQDRPAPARSTRRTLEDVALEEDQDTSEILRDFVIFEKSSSAGSFFRRFPIHRMLISLNKRNVARGGMDFRMRHDWNSLLGADTLGIAPMTARTTELYPHADVLVQYLRDYAVHLSGHIRFNTKVVRLSREDEHFHLERVGKGTNASGEQRAQRLVQRCGLVVLAVGLTPSLPQDVVGSHLLTGYEELEPRIAQCWFGDLATPPMKRLVSCRNTRRPSLCCTGSGATPSTFGKLRALRCHASPSLHTIQVM